MPEKKENHNAKTKDTKIEEMEPMLDPKINNDINSQWAEVRGRQQKKKQNVPHQWVNQNSNRHNSLSNCNGNNKDAEKQKSTRIEKY